MLGLTQVSHNKQSWWVAHKVVSTYNKHEVVKVFHFRRLEGQKRAGSQQFGTLVDIVGVGLQEVNWKHHELIPANLSTFETAQMKKRKVKADIPYKIRTYSKKIEAA